MKVLILKFYFYLIKKNIQTAQLKAKLDEVGLITGRNIFLIDDIFQFSVKINKEKTVKVNIEYNEDITIQNYGIFFADEIKDISELNIFLNNNKAQEKPDNLVKHC